MNYKYNTKQKSMEISISFLSHSHAQFKMKLAIGNRLSIDDSGDDSV